MLVVVGGNSTYLLEIQFGLTDGVLVTPSAAAIVGLSHVTPLLIGIRLKSALYARLSLDLSLP